jgi:hypothetical protein
MVAKGICHTAKTREYGVWVAAFAGTTRGEVVSPLSHSTTGEELAGPNFIGVRYLAGRFAG